MKTPARSKNKKKFKKYLKLRRLHLASNNYPLLRSSGYQSIISFPYSSIQLIIFS